jgi:hypothetical protein
MTSMSSVFNDKDLRQLVGRIQQLQPSMQARWGVMNAAEMLHHCTASLRVIMQAEPTRKSTSVIQYLLRFYFMYVSSKFPANAKTPKRLDVKKTPQRIKDFDAEKDELISVLSLFTMQQHIYAMHPYFGKLSRKQWGIFTWKHIDHHLRQFGV